MSRHALRTFSVFALSAGAAHSASAFDWNGYYGGLNLGGAFLENSMITSDGIGQTVSDTKTDKSVTFGGQVGWNLQSGDFLLGLEGDFNYLNLHSSLGTTQTKSTSAVRSDYDWFATVRGRAGIVFNTTTLVYATAGIAFLDHGMRYTRVGFGGLSTSRSDLLSGATVGGGVEHAFHENWTAKIEYLYASFGRKAIFDPGPGPIGAFGSSKPTLHVIRAGVNWHF